ncbi:phenylacetate-coenzyme A ligase PaaK, adenylate-forming domain family [Desulfuromonas soudanensis]|uniref:Phenylacetate-coenzyme A ligase PaaK, adenylate-forming domain family n=1 Tax=Desulfuromonas soudanensis TaxID=1603606 RepID=A0A0M4D1K2_9BACT|nr:AMP-binding protein [Desulfuromonas soudanensis]ALC16001.1 phenylacetate-coenzyme A ligase PaaK, adenylate-forming domain family [Desulfuromonas soudanensis]
MFDVRRALSQERTAGDLLRKHQDELLRRHLAYIAGHSPFYRRLLAGAGIDPSAIAGVSDLGELPFTTKADLEEYNEELLCTSRREIVDLCLTSGTTGKPVAMLQTRQDLDRVACNEELSFRRAGLEADDRVLIAAAIDRCFMAGLAYFLGLTRIGAMVIRGGSSSVPHLGELVRRYRPTAIVGVPSLLAALGLRLREEGCDPALLGVGKLICIGEPVRSADLSLSVLGQRLVELWGAQIYGTYASTEMATAFTDCAEGRGGHVPPELVLVETVDELGRPSASGEPGEVVATPLQVTGMPLLRYRTGDIATLHTDPCPCGSLTPRLGPVLGRKAQMLKIRGTTVYPPAIFAVLQEWAVIQGYFIEVYDDFELSDRIRVVVGSREAGLSAETVAERIGARIRVKPEVVLTTPEEIVRRTLQGEKRKPVTFFDYRRSGLSDDRKQDGANYSTEKDS